MLLRYILLLLITIFGMLPSIGFSMIGTPVAATDASGKVLWQTPRQSYGTLSNQRSDKKDYPIGYTGHYEDSENQLKKYNMYWTYTLA